MYAISQITTLIGAHRYGTAETNIGFVLTDSRSLSFPEETLFFAIKTQRSDGHKYIQDLYNRGVRNFVVNREYDVPKDLPKSNFLVVTDTVEALQRLAERHREEYDIPVIGITGSNGKTTVKEWLYQLLFKDKRITRSPRSYNSQIGVPQSVWMINNQTELGIFEAGISQVGEMQALQEIIQPTIAVLTNIGQAHQENFRSVREKCEEKLHLMKDAKVVVYNADDATVSHCMRKSNFKGFRLGWSMENPDAPLYINNVETDDEKHETRISYIYNGSAGDYCIKNINEGGIENSITCAAVCLYLGMSQKTLAERMPQLEAIAMRLEVKQGQRGCILINDSYNNDVKSLDIALDFMSRRA